MYVGLLSILYFTSAFFKALLHTVCFDTGVLEIAVGVGIGEEDGDLDHAVGLLVEETEIETEIETEEEGGVLG